MTVPDEGGGGATDVLHVDMDCFFAQIEVLADPSLRARPVVVGGTGGRGVVASASYEARAFGIASAMPMAEARRRCPSAAFLPVRHEAYAAVHRRLVALCASVTPLVEPVALDEAYLDVSGAHRLLGPSPAIAIELRRAIAAELGLVCSVGVGRTKLVAKLASRAAKPSVDAGTLRSGPGVRVVSPARELDFLWPHPVSALPGVGPRAAGRLRQVGVETVGELAALEAEQVRRLLGRARGDVLHALAWGHDPRPVRPERPVRSIGREETFPRDDACRDSLARKVRELAAAVAERCRQEHVLARTVTLKVRFGDLATTTRSVTSRRGFTTAAEIAAAAGQLLGSVDVERTVRLLGVSASGLCPLELAPGHQLDLFGAAGATSDGRRGELEAATASIRRRYGEGAIGPAAEVARGARRARSGAPRAARAVVGATGARDNVPGSAG
ncbi:MAG TPA: DNA polymerase IV [Acidimicrobiales bacterium]|nr:DNA polymerase IV [Acidimicrobiales bacterium]